MAQSFITAATVSAMEGSMRSPKAMVLCSDLYTSLGRRSRMTRSLKTLLPKMSVGLVSAKLSGAASGL